MTDDIHWPTLWKELVTMAAAASGKTYEQAIEELAAGTATIELRFVAKKPER
jgi:hypothetical protein